jgi:sugar phosphate isomerase/epimerase
MIKTSFCTIAFQKDKWGADRAVEMHLREILPILAAAGYDGAELWGPHVMDMSDGELDELAGLLREGRLAPAMISPYFDFTTSGSTAGQSVTDGLRAIEIARKLGAGGIRCFTGRVGGAEASAEQWDRAVAGLRELADAGAPDGIFLACETHGRNLMDTVDSSIELIERVDRMNVGLIFQPDTFGQRYLDALDRLGSYARHVHASNGEAYLGEGQTDYARIVAGLRRFGFDGFISVEWMGPDPAAAAAHEAPYLRKLLGR